MNRITNKVGTLFICFVIFTSWWCSAEVHSVYDVDNSMKFGQKIDEEVAKKVDEEVAKKVDEEVVKKVDEGTPKKPKGKKFNVSEHRFLLSKIQDGRPYGVYDNILRYRTQVMLKSYLTYNNDGWLFNNYDQYDENKQRTHDNTPWLNEKDPLEFSHSPLCRRLISAVRDVSKNNEEYYPYRVFGKILRRGDHTLVSADSNETGEYTAFVFVNEFWRKNYYGELYLYDANREIVGGATHRPGRVVIYESTILRLNRPPAVAFMQGQVLFQVQFSNSMTKMEEGHQKWSSYIQERTDAKQNWFVPDYKHPNGDPFTPPDPEKHKVFEYTTKTDGRKIFVYDDLFPKDLLDNLRGFVLKYGTYFYDDSVDSESDNVQWIAGFMLKPYIQSPYWKIVKTVAKHATGSDKMFPYDVSINLVRSSDHTRIHGDVGYYGEEEFTCLVYLNPNWKKNYYGETTFFEKNSDDTEIVAQVRPRYGRTVIFDGNIPHSARPPSFNFTGARLTFVTKLHKNEYTGRKKNFQEEYRHLSSTLGSFNQLRMYQSKKGEAYAKAYLDELRKSKEKLTYRTQTKEDGDEDDEGEKEENEEMDEKEAKGGKEDDSDGSPSESTGGKYSSSQEMEDGMEKPFFEEEADDEYTNVLAESLEDVTEQSVDGVERIINAHEKMGKMAAMLTKKLGESIVKAM